MVPKSETGGNPTIKSRIQRGAARARNRLDGSMEVARAKREKPRPVVAFPAEYLDTTRDQIGESTGRVMLVVLSMVVHEHNMSNPNEPAVIEAGYADAPEVGGERLGGPVWLISWGHSRLGKVVGVVLDTLNWAESHIVHGIEKIRREDGSLDVDWHSLDLQPGEEDLGFIAKIRLAMSHAQRQALEEEKNRTRQI